MPVSKAKKLRRLAKENNRLKKLLAERDVEIDGLKKLALRSVARGLDILKDRDTTREAGLRAGGHRPV